MSLHFHNFLWIPSIYTARVIATSALIETTLLLLWLARSRMNVPFSTSGMEIQYNPVDGNRPERSRLCHQRRPSPASKSLNTFFLQILISMYLLLEARRREISMSAKVLYRFLHILAPKYIFCLFLFQNKQSRILVKNSKLWHQYMQKYM